MTEILKTKTLKEETPSQPWLASASFDCFFILSPAFLASLAAVSCHGNPQGLTNLPLWAWVSLVLCVDVAHVYASLFRTYLDKEAWQKNKALLSLIPIFCYFVGVVLYAVEDLLFWGALAYLAVFHFIRQQYGLSALYGRHESPLARRFFILDGICIYAVTLYPVIYWHCHLPRNFNWFIEGDFFSLNSLASLIEPFAFTMYLLCIFAYAAKELYLFSSGFRFNLPKNLIVCGTALSWWLGIVYFNSDLAFTMTNVLSHGIPYMALVWVFQKKRVQVNAFNKRVNPIGLLLSYAPLFIAFLISLAYLEEGLWDGLIWREHLQVFPLFSLLPKLEDSALLTLLIPALALPQSVHYVLDGFIWRIKDRNSIWST